MDVQTQRRGRIPAPDLLATTRSVAPDRDDAACLPRIDFGAIESQLPAGFGTIRRRLRRGEALYRAGDAWYALFAVRSGSFAARRVSAAGAERVMECCFPGDVLGADGLWSGCYPTEAVALDAGEVYVFAPERFASLAQGGAAFQRVLTRMLARALAQHRGVLRVHGAPSAFGRVAQLLILHGERLCPIGVGRSTFKLPMTRDQLGSHVGLRLETVSRALSAFHKARLATVHGRSVRIDDWDGLREVARSGMLPAAPKCESTERWLTERGDSPCTARPFRSAQSWSVATRIRVLKQIAALPAGAGAIERMRIALCPDAQAPRRSGGDG